MSDEKRRVIDCKVGDKVVYANPSNGWPGDQRWAAEHLTLNQTYTVAGIDIGNFYSTVYIGAPIDKWFNTVMFEVVL